MELCLVLEERITKEHKIQKSYVTDQGNPSIPITPINLSHMHISTLMQLTGE